MTALALTIRTAIERAISRFNLPDSEAAVRLLLMVAAHESGGFTYCKQKGGPALGIFQMEPATYADVCNYLERTGRFPALNTKWRPTRMVIDVEFAAGMARAFFSRIPEPLPDPDDLQALAEYAKKHWNTELGKATPEKYLTAYKHHVLGDDV